MSNDDSQQPPFKRKEAIHEPGIVGAQWWNDGLTAMGDPVSRRKALRSLAAFGGTVLLGGLILSECDSDPEEHLDYFDSLQMQRERGWDFGSGTQTLTFTGPQNAASALEAPEQLVTELTPRQDALKPYYQATLFQALAQRPPGVAGEPSTSLRNVLKPIFTPEMNVANLQGEALRELFEREEDTATAVMVDLPGPESVAFAAALASRFEPIFTFDNWPHPLGVVPAHLTLAAVTYYRDTLKRLAAQRPVPAPPVFVLDRNRLTTYSNPETQFDNRYVARLPPTERMKALGFKHVLYVLPEKAPLSELDDLNEDFTAYRAAGIDVRLVAASDFWPDAFEDVRNAGAQMATDSTASGAGGASADASRPRYYFGGSPLSHATFWSLYPWGRTPGARVDPSAPPFRTSGGHRYVPQARATMFTGLPRASAPGTTWPRPRNFGMVMMRVASTNRNILGPAFGPHSSWQRSGGSSSYGG